MVIDTTISECDWCQSVDGEVWSIPDHAFLCFVCLQGVKT